MQSPARQAARCRALAIHADAATREKHEQLGLHPGWGAALDQLVALLKER